MTRYQIRTPDNQIMEDVINTLAETAWRILKAWEVFQEGTTPDDFQNFHLAIYQRMEPYLMTYRLCGASSVCLDEAVKTQWSPVDDTLQSSSRDLVYHLFPGKDLEIFLDDLVRSAMDSAAAKIKPEKLHEVCSILKTAFRAVLGQYIYANPLCGKTDLCIVASSTPEKVWGRPRF